MTGSVLANIAALKAMPAPVLKQRWRELFDSEPPPYNRRFLEMCLQRYTLYLKESLNRPG